MADRFQTLFTTGDLTPEMEELGIQDISAYKGSPQLISQVPGEQFTDISYNPYGQTAYSDLYNLYYGGLPTTEVAQAPADTTPVDTNVVGEGGGGGNLLDQLETDTGIDAPINVDTPLTQMITTPTGDTMTVKEAFTQDPAYTGIDTAPDYSDVTTAVAPPSILNPYEPQTLASPTLNKMDTSEIDIENFLDSEPALTAGKPEMLGDTGDSMDYMSGALDAPYGVNPNT